MLALIQAVQRECWWAQTLAVALAVTTECKSANQSVDSAVALTVQRWAHTKVVHWDSHSVDWRADSKAAPQAEDLDERKEFAWAALKAANLAAHWAGLWDESLWDKWSAVLIRQEMMASTLVALWAPGSAAL